MPTRQFKLQEQVSSVPILDNIGSYRGYRSFIAFLVGRLRLGLRGNG